MKDDTPKNVFIVRWASGVKVEDFKEANLLRLWLDEVGGEGVRLQVRPSGTEPKVKLYGEAVDVEAEILQSLLAALAAIL